MGHLVDSTERSITRKVWIRVKRESRSDFRASSFSSNGDISSWFIAELFWIGQNAHRHATNKLGCWRSTQHLHQISCPRRSIPMPLKEHFSDRRRRRFPQDPQPARLFKPYSIICISSRLAIARWFHFTVSQWTRSILRHRPQVPSRDPGLLRRRHLPRRNGADARYAEERPAWTGRDGVRQRQSIWRVLGAWQAPWSRIWEV